MTGWQEHKILLLGSLPPVPSNAALWTHLVAEQLQESGLDVVVLLDALAPPPTTGSGLKIVRPFDDDFKGGMYDEWPRLAIIGNMADSLPTLSQLHHNPSAVLVADRSLFDIALMKSELDQDWTSLRQWLGETLGSAGNRLASAIIDHKRIAAEIGKEICAFDLVIPSDCIGIGLSNSQLENLKPAGTLTRILPRLISASAPLKAAAKNCLVIGMRKTTRDRFHNSCRLPIHARLAFEDRHSRTVVQSIADSDVVVILDGYETALCPLVVRALNEGKTLVVADQHWVKELPIGSVLTIANATSEQAIAHALQFATTSPALRSVVVRPEHDKADHTANFVDAVYEVASQGPKRPLKAETLTFNVPTNIKNLAKEEAPDGAWSLIGAIPVLPILEQSYPGLDLENCPRFLSLEHAQYLAALTETPLISIASHLGYEDALLSDGTSPIDNSIALKVKPWSTIEPHLNSADRALAFGCAIDGARRPEAVNNLTEPHWLFALPSELTERTHLNQQLDSETGVYWRYHEHQNTISILLTTGAAGIISMAVQRSDLLVISDGTKTVIAEKGLAQEFEVPPHGMVLLRITTMPKPDGKPMDVRKILAGVPINLKWSSHD